MYLTKNALANEKKDIQPHPEHTLRNMLIIIPALREQKIIEKTLEHFKKLKIENIVIYIAIAGTNRERKIKDALSTKETVLEWIDNYESSSFRKENLHYYFFEADDQNGDRATQLNFAVDEFKRTTKVIPSVIGIYDADSLPNTDTLIHVVNSYHQDANLTACQQPVHFVDVSNEMAKGKANPILVANAMYQSTWTIIRELPRWLHYYKHCLSSDKLYKRNIYLIGHGQFLTYKDYDKFKFPEHEVTDGIQLGYRMAMSKKSITPLPIFCSDDAPRDLKQLIQQHKRWFGGCMRLKKAYYWSKENFGTKAIYQLLDGLWSQFSWAWASLLSIIAVILSFFYHPQLSGIILILVCIYCYAIPLLAHQILPTKLKVRFIDWLCLPLAIAIKGIGPNKYFIETAIYSILFKKAVSYKKVERNA